MSKEKRYYWLKLKNDFFYQKEIKMLRKCKDEKRISGYNQQLS